MPIIDAHNWTLHSCQIVLIFHILISTEEISRFSARSANNGTLPDRSVRPPRFFFLIVSPRLLQPLCAASPLPSMRHPPTQSHTDAHTRPGDATTRRDALNRSEIILEVWPGRPSAVVDAFFVSGLSFGTFFIHNCLDLEVIMNDSLYLAVASRVALRDAPCSAFENRPIESNA